MVRPRELVCILGPSGCGKSTLLSALSARRPADEGSVLLNGEDLYAQFEALKQNLAVVPQEETLHDMLPLDAALRYTARLRLPSDMSRTEIENCVSAMLDSVRLSEHRATRIRQLSGGQRKRASWVNEAICNPSLIFLDEVTSGLDEQTDCEMMQLFRKMADDGKTVVCVTHRVGYVEETCHLAAILGPGGVLAFFGPPAEALAYFDVPRLGEVYQRLQERSPEEWKQRFRQSSQYQRYVEQRLPRDAPRKVLPASRSRKSRSQESLVAGRQLLLLVRRYLAILLADKGMLAMMLGQSLLIALLLSWVFGDISQPSVEAEARRVADVAAPGVAWAELLPETQAEFRQEASEAATASLTAKILFLLGISCLWFGCNNAAKEIVKERAIYSRERDVGLKVDQLLRLETDRPRRRQHPAVVPVVCGRSPVHPSGRRWVVAIRAPLAGFLDGRRDRTGHLGGRQQRRRGGDDGAHLADPADHHGRDSGAAGGIHARPRPACHFRLLELPGTSRHPGVVGARPFARCRHDGSRHGMGLGSRLQRPGRPHPGVCHRVADHAPPP